MTAKDIEISAQPQSAPTESDSIESLRLKIKKKISNLKEAMMTKDKEISALQASNTENKRTMTAKDREISVKDNEISALQAFTSKNKRAMTAKDKDFQHFKR
jgi:hypothetical protein